MLFWQFSNIIMYVKILVNTRSTFKCMLILQSREKGPDSCWKYGTDLSRSSPSFWTLSPGFENNHTFKCWSGIFATILTYMNVLENCQNNISEYGGSPIQGTKLNSCLNLMKPGSQSGTYLYRPHHHPVEVVVSLGIGAICREILCQLCENESLLESDG